MNTNLKYIASILLITAFSATTFGQQLSTYLKEGQQRKVIKLGEPILLLESVSVELKSMTVAENRILELVFNVQNVSFPGTIVYNATTRIMRDAEGLQYERQTIADWGSGGKRLLEGTKLESVAKISLKDGSRNQHEIIPVVIASALNLRFFHKESLINPYRRNIFQQAIPVAILEIDKDELQKTIQAYSPKPIPKPERANLPTLSLDMKKFNKLKFGMKYQEVVAILGGEGAKSRSSMMTSTVSSSSVRSSKSAAYDWRSANNNRISCNFIDGELAYKNYYQSMNRDVADADLTLEKFNKLREGMTYEKVKEILGSHGLHYLTSESSTRVLERFWWRNKKGNIRVSFRDGALSRKSESGLD